MQKYKLIVADTTNPAYSKMSAQVAQAIGAGFGYLNYKWVPLPDDVLLFNPNTKSVSVVKRNQFSNTSFNLVYVADYLVQALQNPEKNLIQITSVDGFYKATIEEDKITFHSNYFKVVGCVAIPKDFIHKVLGSEKPDESKVFPIVSFYYSSTDNGVSQLRTVQVTKMDDKYICGYELARGHDSLKETKQFKKYLVSKAGVVELQLYCQDEK